jgi:hypothetical protein
MSSFRMVLFSVLKTTIKEQAANMLLDAIDINALDDSMNGTWSIPKFSVTTQTLYEALDSSESLAIIDAAAIASGRWNLL